MAELTVSFKLGERDLARLRNVMQKASKIANRRSEAEIMHAAEELVEEVRAASAPTYVVDRVEQLDLMVGMLKDAHWIMPEAERRKALAAIAYFADPHDLIPDHIPGLGFLDDAIMIELAIGDLRHEIAGYREFCRFRHAQWEVPWHRQSAGRRDRKIASRQVRLRERIDARLAKESGRTQRAR